MKQNKPKREKRVRAYADIGSHGGIFELCGGAFYDRYPTIMHIYSKKISPDLKPVTIVYKV